MSAHTPAPWFVVPPPWDRTGTIVANREDPHGAKIICDTGDIMLWRDHVASDVYEWQANAHLVAASPDLLAACRELMEWLNEVYPPAIFTGVSGDEGPLRIVAMRNRANAAIAKADAP